MKKIFCLFFTMILIGSLLIIPIYASLDDVVIDNDVVIGDDVVVNPSADEPSDNDYILLAGRYYLNDVLTDFSTVTGYTYIDFSAGSSFDALTAFTSFYFYVSSSQGGLVLRFEGASPRPYIYLNGVGYINGLFRCIYIPSDQYINHDFYYWFNANTTYLDAPQEPVDVGSSVLSVFSALSEWFISAFSNITPMFYSSGFTLLGYIFLLPLCLVFLFLFIQFIVSCIMLRR